jgi:2-phospho-L-lactate guanylyltransferase
MRWTVVIPVRAPGKSRLGRGPEFARAIALDTIEAALSVADVVVVTPDAEVAEAAAELGAEVVLEERPAGLESAIRAGLPRADHARAVLLGDLPALRPRTLELALTAALDHERAFIPDADGTGTTLVTARAGSGFVHRFGPDSARAHRSSRLVELQLPVTSTLRRDVDLEKHLQQLGGRLGPRTSAALEWANSGVASSDAEANPEIPGE